MPTVPRLDELSVQGKLCPILCLIPAQPHCLRILPAPLQASRPFESTGRISTCFCRGFIASC